MAQNNGRTVPRVQRTFVWMACLALLAGTAPPVSGATADAPPQLQSDPVCAAVVAAANSGGLSAMMLPSRPLSPEEARRLFPEMRDALQAYYEADLDGDGAPEHVGVSGPQAVPRVAIISARTGTPANVEALKASEPRAPVALLRVTGRSFLLSGEPPTRLYELGPDARVKQRCMFGRADQPVHLVTVAEEPAVCAAYESDALPRVAFDHIHILGLLDRTQYPETRPVEGLARVDIDNDGRQENIVRLHYSGPPGPLCGTFFAVADASRARLAETPLNPLLRQMPCGTEPRLFTSASRTYVALQETETKWSLLTLRANAWRRVCVREARVGIRALSPREGVEARAGQMNPWLYALTASPDPLADVQALIQGGRDVNETTGVGSPLQQTVWAARPDVAALLLAKGVRPDLMQEALDGAVLRKDPDMVVLLFQHGAAPSPATLASLACDQHALGLLELFGQTGLLAADAVPAVTAQGVPRNRLPSDAGSGPAAFQAGGEPATPAPGSANEPVGDESPLVIQARRCGNLDAISIIEKYRGRP
jgi:hypothetical protein